MTKKIWEYIKAHDLQDPDNRRNILPDKKLAALLGTKEAVDMFQLPKLLAKHLSKEKKGE